MTQKFRIIWIKIATAALLIIPGLIMITAPVSPFSAAVDAFLDLAYQPFNGEEVVSTTAALLLNAILGGVLVGFGIMIWMVADRVYRQDMALGRTLMMIPILSWFVCDSAGSILAGAWFNAILNVGILLSLITPLLWPIKST